MIPVSSAQPRVLITHERFLFRFGADRVFLLIAERLKALGCHVTMLGARYDRAPLEACSDLIVTMPMPSIYRRSDEFCSRWFRETFLPRAQAQGGYDLIIHGGWTLLGATEAMRQLSPRVMFLDHGVGPGAGYPPGTQEILRHLQQLRRHHLPACTHAAGVSRFIVETQTIPDVGPRVPVQVLLNGADHLSQPAPTAASGEALERVRRLAANGHPLILSLGRYESGTYKNSQVALEVFRLVRSALPAARLLVLESPANLRPPEYLSHGVELINFPDDNALAEIIRLVSLGFSTSLWEGYNLPLVELLRSGTPALAFRIGAHAEVVPHPWFLCADRAQLAAKTVSILQDDRPARALLQSPAAQAHWQQLTWERFVRDLIAFVDLPIPTAMVSCS
jgi:glycosyltransferase involved in cell wall biosynthesis